MKIISLLSLLLVFGLLACETKTEISKSNTPSDNTGERITELNAYWSNLAKTAADGDFEGMKALYHADGVIVKSDTTFSAMEAFRVRWKDEIMEVNQGVRVNTLDFRFSKRIGDQNTASEQGIFHYTSKESATDSMITDTFVHFETLLVKNEGRWVALMESQKQVATLNEWEQLKK